MGTLVVVAYHNGEAYINNLMDSLGDERGVSIVDTGSDHPNYNYSSEFVPGGGCIAAYAHAYRGHRKDYDSFLFLHDSMVAKKKKDELISEFASRKKDVVAWIGFDMGVDPWQAEYLGQFFVIGSELPKKAIFGPIFYATRPAMDALTKRSILPERSGSRIELSAWERGYAIAFHKAGIQMDYLEEYDNERIDVKRDYRLFDKFRPNRS